MEQINLKHWVLDGDLRGVVSNQATKHTTRASATKKWTRMDAIIEYESQNEKGNGSK
jgi:hypothetical protein